MLARVLRTASALFALAVVVVLLAGSTGCESLENPPPSAPPLPRGPLGKPGLLRGLNLGNALEAPHEGDWGVVLDEADFPRVRAQGFDHVRLPVSFSAHAGMEAPYTIDDAFLRRVDWAIARALSNDLAIIVDMHNYDDLMKHPDANAARFVSLWRQVAERYRGTPEGVCFELLNEPHGDLTAAHWNTMLADALRVVRATNPTRTVIVEGVDWGSAQNLRDTLRIPDDPAVVASFHMYQPILFTHQGARFMNPEFGTTGVRFPGPPATPLKPVDAADAMSWVHEWFDRYNREPSAGNPSGPRTITEQLDMASAFAASHRIPVYMGEFGAIDNADMESRAGWIRMTRQEAEKRGFGWAYWDDGGSFKAYDRQRGAWVPELLAALRH
jgi:endoglucanase